MSEWRDKILAKYLRVCKAATEDDTVFRTFKAHPHYHEVLEHCPKDIADNHWDNIRHDYFTDEDMNLFLMNDIHGSPKRSRFGKYTASPTTIQYISVLSNLITRFGVLEGFEVAAIGDGYGGQTKIIKDKFRVRCDIIDLYECTLLQEKYLRKLNRFENVRLFTNENYALAGEHSKVKEYDLFISNYALSEVSAEDQLKYVQDICLNSARGYITANAPLNGIELLKDKFNVKTEPDIKGERETNYLITWDSTK